MAGWIYTFIHSFNNANRNVVVGVIKHVDWNLNGECFFFNCGDRVGV